MLQHVQNKLIKLFGLNIFRSGLFLIIGLLIWGTLQNILAPRRYPYIKAYDAGKLRYYYGEEKNSIDAIISGSSHAGRAIIPMELYEKYQIKSYNLSTSIQPIEATYYTLQEALTTQSPKVFIFDVANLFYERSPEACWKSVLDELPIGKNKFLLSQEYLNYAETNTESIFNLLFPLLQYHTRWKEISKQDFDIFNNNQHYFGKGATIDSVIWAGRSVDEMNFIANEMLKNTEKIEYQYMGSEIIETREEDFLYSTKIPEKNINWLLKIKDVCDRNDIQLLAIKVPVIYWPQVNSSAWTNEKYNEICSLCNKYGITYFDMLYDVDVNIDYEKDSHDGGIHLNLYGGQKISACLGYYLINHYEFSNESNNFWDKDLISYQKVRDIALLQLEQDFVTYINMLSDKHNDKTIFIAVSDNILQELNSKDVEGLKRLGLMVDFSDLFQKSYIAVIENGEIRYEAMSNRPLKYSGICNKSGKKYELYSSGWLTNSCASILLDDNEFAINGRGINIVIYDDIRELVVDSVCFDTCTELHTPTRNNNKINEFEENFERYIMEIEDK